MSLSTRIAAHLPYLRRYARAVTGSQTSGDAYVAAVLETLIEDVSLFPEDGDDKVSLYKLFSQLFSSTTIEIEEIESPFSWEKRAAANLMALPAKPRQAFLLISLENFSHEETAQILDVESDSVSNLIDEASSEIARQVATDIMIIEDEPLISMQLEDLVTSLGHEVCGTAATRTQAQEVVAQKTPGLVLADLDLDWQQEIRQAMPIQQHKRFDKAELI